MKFFIFCIFGFILVFTAQSKEQKIDFIDRVLKIKETSKNSMIYLEIGPSVCILNKKNKNYSKFIKIIRKIKSKNKSAKFTTNLKNYEIIKIVPEK